MKFLIYSVISYIFQVVVGQNYLNYVCKSYFDYGITRAKNSNCYYSGDVFNSFEEIAWSYGYNVQVFEVITEDQYILKVFRILPKENTPFGDPILLQHGTTLSSTNFMLVGNHSLAFVLANEGYDVWIGNLRGTTYSSGHKFLTYNDKKYWDFSFHEYGVYDVKAFIDLVTSVSRKKVIFIGYSLGSRMYNIYNSIHHEEANEKLRLSITLGPTTFMHYNKSPFATLSRLVPYQILKAFLDILFPKGVVQLKTFKTTKRALHFCLDSPIMVFLCEFIKGLTSGFNFIKEAPETFPLLIAQTMEPTSLKLFYHTEQSIRHKEFRQFDYGSKKNLEYYGTKIPPIYNLSKILVPNYIVYGSGDFLATEKGARVMYQKLPQQAKPFGKPYQVADKRFSHINFIAHRDVKILLYDHIVRFLKENESYFNN